MQYEEHADQGVRDLTEVEAAEARLAEAIAALGFALDKLEHRLEHVLRYPTPHVISAAVDDIQGVSTVALKLPDTGSSPLTDFLSAQAAALTAQTGRIGELVERLAV